MGNNLFYGYAGYLTHLNLSVLNKNSLVSTSSRKGGYQSTALRAFDVTMNRAVVCSGSWYTNTPNYYYRIWNVMLQ